MRIRLLVLAICSWTLAGCATTPGGKIADGAAHADHGTTAIALTAVEGAAEVNPLAPLAPLRYWVHSWAETQRCEDRGVLKLSTAVAGGASGNNLLVFAEVANPIWGLLAAIPAYIIAKRNECEPYVLPEHEALIAKWERAYESGDIGTIRAMMDNDELTAKYEALIAETTERHVEYARIESVRGGVVADYEARFVYPDRVSNRDGEMTFRLNDGLITDT